jgi:hypothetical protein
MIIPYVSAQMCAPSVALVTRSRFTPLLRGGTPHYRQSRTGGHLINRNRPSTIASHTSEIAGRSFSMPFVANAPRAATEAGRGQSREKFQSIFQTLFAHARRTRPVFLHIPDSQNLTFVVSGVGRGCSV